MDLERTSRVSSRTTQKKALRINLDDNKYGTIVEIGAGQDVARQFFLAGGAAGTIAKTMSAYDMTVSDHIYGVQEEKRYVSKSRLKAMLSQEYSLLLKRLHDTRPENSRFFTYAATAAAKSFSRDNECHAWCGVRLQMYPNAEPSDIIVHVRMHDRTAVEQQEALGVFGVNLIYAAYYYADSPKKLIDSLTDNLKPDQIEVNLIEFHGPLFEEVDNLSINFHLIKSWKTRAVTYHADGYAISPSDLLYKKNILAVRGTFAPVTNLNIDMINQGLTTFLKQEGVDKDNSIIIAEITLSDLSGNVLNMSERDILTRIKLLTSLGYHVIISDYVRYFTLRAYLRQFTKAHLGIVLGVVNIKQIFNEDFYKGIEGGILEGFGKLFPDNTKLFVYPEKCDGDIIDYKNVMIPNNLRFLYKHLIENHFIEGLNYKDESLFDIHSKDIAKDIAKGIDGWQNKIPDAIAKIIIDEGLLGYKNPGNDH